MINLDPLREILAVIEKTDYASANSPELLMAYAFQLKGWMAYSGSEMARAKFDLHARRKQVMINLMANMKANGTALSANLQREYVNDCCADENMAYELAERVNRTCSHAIDLIRTCISTLREEMRMTN